MACRNCGETLIDSDWSSLDNQQEDFSTWAPDPANPTGRWIKTDVDGCTICAKIGRVATARLLLNHNFSADGIGSAEDAMQELAEAFGYKLMPA